MTVADWPGNEIPKNNHLLFVTARIFGHLQNGGEFCATSFFFNLGMIPNQRETNLILITNKHVFDGVSDAGFRMHKSIPGLPNKPSGNSVLIPIELERHVVNHPDPDIDICAILVNRALDRVGIRDGETCAVSFTPEHCGATHELLLRDPAEDVVMIGYPNGLWDDVNNLPLIRKGITATHPGIDYRGKPIGLIDMPCTMGSSGSPVLTHHGDAIIHTDDPNVAKIKAKIFLLGVYSDSYRTINEGDEEIQLHLGQYWKAREVVVLARIAREMIEKNDLC